MDPNSESAADRFRSLDVVRLALGYLYVHFGVLKFFPDLSPAEVIASYTMMKLLGFQMAADGALFWVAVMECVIGVGLLLKAWMRLAGALFLIHMAGTLMPLFILPEFTFKFFPFAPTTEGQYILKNLVLIAAGWSVVEPHFRWTRPSQTDVPEHDNTQPAQT